MPDTDYLCSLVAPLLRLPEKLVFSRTVDAMGVLFTLTVDKEDMGRLLGRDGSTIQAVRTLVHVFGQIHEARISVKLLEPQGSTHRKARTLTETISAMTDPNPQLSTVGTNDTDL